MALFSSPVWESPPAASVPAMQTPPQMTEIRRPAESLISGLTALAEREGVIISFMVSGSQKSTVLYRNTQPIRQIQDLLNGIVRTGISSPFIDYPAPGSSYYYAILFEDDISRSLVEIQPGRNSTINAAEVRGRAEPRPDIRSMPLPSLTVNKTSPTSDYYSNLPGSLEETAKTQDAAQPPHRRSRAFATDLEAPSGGEEAILRTIVQGPFSRREWQNAGNELLQYLSMPRSAAAEARARFYLGQIYYFSGKNHEALIEFLFAQSLYPNEANEWIEAVLAVLAG
jgi:hypothetical protein